MQQKDYLNTVMGYALFGKEERDHRGLMPLEDARRLLVGFESFEAGELVHVGEQCCSESDRTFAALCSLENPAEFLALIMGKPWNHPPRMDLVCALAQRYGEDIVPWLETMVQPDGNFPRGGCYQYSEEEGKNVFRYVYPTKLHECLYLLGSDRAAELALRIDQPASDEKVPYFLRWLQRHPDRESWLIARAAQSDERALGMIEFRDGQLAKNPKIRAVLKEAETVRVKKGKPLTYVMLQEALDNGGCPSWSNLNVFCGAMTVTGFADPECGDALVVQSLVHNSTFDGIVRDVWRIGGSELPMYSPITTVQVFDDSILYTDNGDLIPLDVVPAPLLGVDVPTTVDPAKLPEGGAERLDLDDIRSRVAVRLGQDHRDRVFLDDEALREAARLSAKAKALFRFDGFRLPDGDESLSDALDLLAMLEALKKRKAIRRLPSGAHPLDGLCGSPESGAEGS
jgi:hypothetical protein